MLKIRDFVHKSLKVCDILGPEFSFEHQGKDTYKSVIGGLYSSIIIIFTAIIGGMFSTDVVFRLNPSVLMSQEILKNSVINFTQIPLSIHFVDINTESDELFSIFYIDLILYQISDKGLNRTILTNVIDKCNFENQTLYDPSMNGLFNNVNNSLKGVYCLKRDLLELYVKNGFSEPDSTFINIRFHSCIEGSPKCPKNVNLLINNGYIVLRLADSYVDSSNFSEPIKYRQASFTVKVTSGLTKRYYYRITRNLYKSDEGWMFQSLKLNDYYSIVSGGNELSFQTPIDGYQPLFWATFESPTLRIVTQRSYMKIQDFFANIGGFTNIVFITINFLTSGHLRFLYIHFLRDLVIFNNEVPNENISKGTKTLIKTNIELVKDLNMVKDKSISSIIDINNFKPVLDPYNNDQRSIIVNNFIECKKMKDANNHGNGQLHVKRKLSSHFSKVEGNASYFSYLVSILFCRSEFSFYRAQMKNIEKLMSIVYFTKVVSGQIAADLT